MLKFWLKGEFGVFFFDFCFIWKISMNSKKLWKKKLEKLKNRYWKMKLKTQIKNKNCSILTKIKSQIDNNMTWLNHEFCVPTNIWYEDLALPPIFVSQADSGGKLFRQKIVHFIESLPPLWDLDFFYFFRDTYSKCSYIFVLFLPLGLKAQRGIAIMVAGIGRSAVGRRRLARCQLCCTFSFNF